MSEKTQPWYVVGHQNPDADAICAAIGHAAYLRAVGVGGVEAIRCGTVPPRVEAFLKSAGLPAPKLVEDVRPTAGSICRREVIRISENDTFIAAYRQMVEHEVRSVPVVNESGEVRGLLRFLDLLQLLLPPATEGLEVRKLQANLKNIAETLEGEMHGAAQCHDDEEELIMMVGASSQDTVENRLREAREKGLIGKYMVICGDRPVVHRHAVHFGARVLVVTGGYAPSRELLAQAAEKGTAVICCKQDTATTVKLALCSRRVVNVLDDRFHFLESSQNLSVLRKEVSRLSQDLFPVVEDGSRELIGVISKSDLVEPPRIRLSLVDHNEFSQAVRGVEEAQVMEILDHHRLSGDLVTREPVRFINEPVGSSSTIVARRFREVGLEPDAATAKCLCAGLISDTLNLTSPTTTSVDREILTWLAALAKVDPDQFAEDYFAAGSLLAEGEAKSIVGMDRKEFSEEGLTVSLSQVEEVSLAAFASRRDELEAELHRLREEKGHALVALLVTDVLKHDSILLAVGEERILEALPYEPKGANCYAAPGVVSRKKQLFPAVCRALRTMRE
ncbi:MAG: putative manganese-dependent inorganic diphosphatase [Verrucomicrobiales bacterium]